MQNTSSSASALALPYAGSDGGNTLSQPTALWRAHGHKLAWLPFILGFSAWVTIEFITGWQYESNDTTNLYLRAARATSWALLPILLVIWLPTLRTLLSLLDRTLLGRWLPLGALLPLHRFLGWGIVLLALVHGSQYLVYYTTLDQPFGEVLLGKEPDIVRAMQTTMYEAVSSDQDIELLAKWIEQGAPEDEFHQRIQPVLKADCTKCHGDDSTMTYAIPEMPLGTYAEVVKWNNAGIDSKQFRVNISGLVMLVMLAALALLALPSVRKRAYHRFQSMHLLVYPLGLLLFLHVPQFTWLLIPLALLGLDRSLERWLRYYPGRAGRVSRISDDLVELAIQVPESMRLPAGGYVRVRIPSLDRREWHSFSITGLDSPRGRLVLLIRCSGDWTQRLAQHATSDNLRVDVQGGFTAPAARAQPAQDWLLIAGGIGITPFLSLLELAKGQHNARSTRVLWVMRDARLLNWIRPWIAAWGEKIQWQVYLTDTESRDWSGAGEMHNVEIRLGLPDWRQAVHAANPGRSQPQCFVCGPDAMAREATRTCQAKGLRVRREVF